MLWRWGSYNVEPQVRGGATLCASLTRDPSFELYAIPNRFGRVAPWPLRTAKPFLKPPKNVLSPQQEAHLQAKIRAANLMERRGRGAMGYLSCIEVISCSA